MVAQQQLANQPAPTNAASNTTAHDRASIRDPITPMQRWAHDLVLEMLKANLPLPSLAAHLKIPFNTLIDYINLPEVKAEIDAYEELCALRARLLGQTARPVSLRRLLDVLESPTPQPSGRDPDSDQRTLHRHAELIRRTATTIARESRALIPKPASKHTPAPNPAPTPTPTPSGATSSRRVREPELVLDPPAPTPAQSPTPTTDNSTDSSSASSSSPTNSCSVALRDLRGESSSSSSPCPSVALRGESSSLHSSASSAALRGKSSSPVRALLRICGTTRSRDHPAL